MEFAQLKIEIEGENVKLTQETPHRDDDDIIVFPIHQAKAVCDAILKLIAQ